MSRTITIIAAFIVGITISSAHGAGEKSARQILDSYVADFRSDPAANMAITFGIRVSGKGGGDWHVVVAGKKKTNRDEYMVTLRDGFPTTPCVYFTIDVPTLRKLDAGKLNALTAMAKAFSTDVTPMDIDTTKDFSPPGEDFFTMKFIPFTFHFWTRGLPEIIPFAGNLTRETHGAHATILYYEKGLRSGWGQMRKGDHVNADPRMQTNPFPSMLILLEGKANAKIGGKNIVLEKGQMLFIPAGVTHEFWNNSDEVVEFILLMFGEGA